MKAIFTVLFLFVGVVTFAQTNENQEPEKQTIEEQFKETYKTSYSYKKSKVIKFVKFNKLQQNVLDTLAFQKNSLANKNNILTKNIEQTTLLQQKITSLESQLQNAITNRNRRSFMGIPVTKGIFSILLAGFFIIFISLAGFFAYKYYENTAAASKSINNFKNLQEEFEQHKKTALKRYQEINRKLQDELNKQWKKDNKG